MEKKIYEKPVMQMEAFMANNYCEDCSAPGHHGYTINFECDAGNSRRAYSIYKKNADGTRTYFQAPVSGREVNGWSFHYSPCGETHQFDVETMEELYTRNDIYQGWMIDDNLSRGWDDIEVTIWTKGNISDNEIHCTTILDPKEWTLAKS